MRKREVLLAHFLVGLYITNCWPSHCRGHGVVWW